MKRMLHLLLPKATKLWSSLASFLGEDEGNNDNKSKRQTNNNILSQQGSNGEQKLVSNARKHKCDGHNCQCELINVMIGF
jgi:hypothetical protein